jgi:hypothetical protein
MSPAGHAILFSRSGSGASFLTTWDICRKGGKTIPTEISPRAGLTLRGEASYLDSGIPVQY